MRYIFSFLTVATLTLSVAAVASASSFSGYWSGTGSVKLPGTKVSIPCDQMDVVISENIGSLTVESVRYTCGGVYYAWQTPATFTIVGDQVLLNGEVVGELNPNKEKFEFTLGTSAGILEVKFQIIGGQMLFQEVLEGINGSGHKASGILNPY